MEIDHLKLPLDAGTFRFANIAVARRYVTPEHVKNAIKEQEQDYITGMPQRCLGEILMDNYLLTEEQMESILDEMGLEENTPPDEADGPLRDIMGPRSSA